MVYVLSPGIVPAWAVYYSRKLFLLGRSSAQTPDSTTSRGRDSASAQDRNLLLHFSLLRVLSHHVSNERQTKVATGLMLAQASAASPFGRTRPCLAGEPKSSGRL